MRKEAEYGYEYPIKARRYGDIDIWVRQMRPDEMPDDGNTYYCEESGQIYAEGENEFEIVQESGEVPEKVWNNLTTNTEERKCQIQSCYGAGKCLEHCPCDCHTTRTYTQEEVNEIITKTEADTLERVRERVMTQVIDRICNRELAQGLIPVPRTSIQKWIKEALTENNNK